MAELPSADGIQGVEDRDAGVGTPETEAEEDDDSGGDDDGGGSGGPSVPDDRTLSGGDDEITVESPDGDTRTVESDREELERRDDPVDGSDVTSSEDLPDSETSTVVFEDEATNDEGQSVPGEVKGRVVDDEKERRVQEFAEQQVRREQRRQRERRRKQQTQQAQQNTTVGSTRRSAQQIRRSIAQNDQVFNQLEKNTRDPGTLNFVEEKIVEPSGRTLANIGGTLAEGTTEIGFINVAGQVQGAQQTVNTLRRDGVTGLGEQLEEDAGEFVDDVSNLDFSTDVQSVETRPENFNRDDDEELSSVERFILPETQNPLSEGDVQSVAFTTGTAAALPVIGTVAGSGAAGATGATVETVDQAPNVAELGTSVVTGNVPGISSSATAIGVDLLPVGSATTKRGTPTDQTALTSDFDRGRLDRARKQDEVETSLDVEPDQLVGVTTKGRQGRLDPDEFTSDVVDERLPRDLTLETQSGETVATNLKRNLNPDPQTTENVELARAEQTETVPGQKTQPDDQTRLQDEFTQDSNTDPTEVEGVVEGQTGRTLVTDKGVVKVEETTTSSFSPVINDRKGSAKPITKTIKDFTESTDTSTNTEQFLDETTSPGKADPDTTPGEQFLAQADINSNTPVSLTGVDEDVQVGDGVTQPLDGILDLDSELNQELDVTADTQQDLDVTPDTDVDQALDVDTTTDTSLTTDTTTTTTTTQTTQQTNTNTNTNTNRNTSTNTNTNINTKRRDLDFDIDMDSVTGDRFVAEVRDEGRFERIGVFDDVEEAFESAEERVDTSDDMTFQVNNVDGSPVDAEPPGDFRESESGPGFVERREDAIDTAGEFSDLNVDNGGPL